jgi:ribosome-binding protein aMBF1 (putative translation factor)
MIYLGNMTTLNDIKDLTTRNLVKEQVKYLRESRIAAGISVENISIELNCNRSKIKRFEKGESCDLTLLFNYIDFIKWL